MYCKENFALSRLQRVRERCIYLFQTVPYPNFSYKALYEISIAIAILIKKNTMHRGRFFSSSSVVRYRQSIGLENFRWSLSPVHKNGPLSFGNY